MSMPRRCPNCYRTEDIRVNFGDNREAEAAFHQRKWCDCDYSSPEEMMQDQDLGFEDPKWLPVAKEFLNRYHRELRAGQLSTKGDHIRCFLISLKSSFDDYRISASLSQNGDLRTFKPSKSLSKKHKPKTDIFDSYNELGELITLDKGLYHEIGVLKRENDVLIQMGYRKNRIIAALICILVIAGVMAIV
jgi:hypothetical protein